MAANTVTSRTLNYHKTRSKTCLVIVFPVSGPLEYIEPDSSQCQIVQDFWDTTCQCEVRPRAYGLGNLGQALRPRAQPDSHVKRCNVLQLQQSSWGVGSAIDEFIRLLNMRKQASEAAGLVGLQCLYLDTVWSAYVHPAANFATASSTYYAMTVEKILAPSALVSHTGCNRCCLDQDRNVSVVNGNRNHWVCIELDMTDCSIGLLDSLCSASLTVFALVLCIFFMTLVHLQTMTATPIVAGSV